MQLSNLILSLLLAVSSSHVLLLTCSRHMGLLGEYHDESEDYDYEGATKNFSVGGYSSDYLDVPLLATFRQMKAQRFYPRPTPRTGRRMLAQPQKRVFEWNDFFLTMLHETSTPSQWNDNSDSIYWTKSRVIEEETTTLLPAQGGHRTTTGQENVESEKQNYDYWWMDEEADEAETQTTEPITTSSNRVSFDDLGQGAKGDQEKTVTDYDYWWMHEETEIPEIVETTRTTQSKPNSFSDSVFWTTQSPKKAEMSISARNRGDPNNFDNWPQTTEELVEAQNIREIPKQFDGYHGWTGGTDNEPENTESRTKRPETEPVDDLDYFWTRRLPLGRQGKSELTTRYDYLTQKTEKPQIAKPAPAGDDSSDSANWTGQQEKVLGAAEEDSDGDGYWSEKTTSAPKGNVFDYFDSWTEGTEKPHPKAETTTAPVNEYADGISSWSKMRSEKPAKAKTTAIPAEMDEYYGYYWTTRPPTQSTEPTKREIKATTPEYVEDSGPEYYWTTVLAKAEGRMRHEVTETPLPRTTRDSAEEEVDIWLQSERCHQRIPSSSDSNALASKCRQGSVLRYHFSPILKTCVYIHVLTCVDQNGQLSAPIKTGNNFDTIEECLATCSSFIDPDVEPVLPVVEEDE